MTALTMRLVFDTTHDREGTVEQYHAHDEADQTIAPLAALFEASLRWPSDGMRCHAAPGRHQSREAISPPDRDPLRLAGGRRGHGLHQIDGATLEIRWHLGEDTQEQLRLGLAQHLDQLIGLVGTPDCGRRSSTLAYQ